MTETLCWIAVVTSFVAVALAPVVGQVNRRLGRSEGWQEGWTERGAIDERIETLLARANDRLRAELRARREADAARLPPSPSAN